MKALSIMLAVLVPGLWECSEGPAPYPGASALAFAGLARVANGAPAAAPDTGQLIVRRVWAGRGVDALGRPTPDGTQLTFVDWSTGNLAVRDMSTGEVRYLTDKPIEHPGYPELSVVSPDGRRVAYHWYPGGWVFELHVVDLDGSNRKILLTDQKYAAPVDWSPDGRQLLLTCQREGGNSLDLLSVVDGERRVLRDFGSARGNARFSPDGRFVVYDITVDEASGQHDIFILPVDGGEERPLIEHEANDYLLGWVPDSDYVLFASDRNGTLGAWVIRVADGEPSGPPRLVKPDLWNVYPMGFSANGTFYYSVDTSTQSVKVATIDPETSRLLSTPTDIDPQQIGRTWRPRWSPDGRYLAYRTGMNRRTSVIAIRSMETGQTRELDIKLPENATPRWAPDGRSFLLLGRDRDQNRGIFRADVQTGEVTPIRLFDQDGGVSYWAGWAPDMRTLYYKVDYGRNSQIVALDVASGTERVLWSARPPKWITIFVAVSPDGDELVFWENDRDAKEARLLIIPTGSEHPSDSARLIRRISGEGMRYPPTSPVQWTSDGKYLLQMFRGEEPDSRRLWRVPVAGGEPEATEFRPGGEAYEFQFSPDGRRVAFQTGEGSREVWVMKNYLPPQEGGER